MASKDSFPMPVRNYTNKVMVLLKNNDVENVVRREPPRRRLDIRTPLSAVKTNVPKKVKRTTYQKVPPSFPVAKTNRFNSSIPIPSACNGPRQSLAASKTRVQAMKHSGKPTTATQEARDENKRPRHTGIPMKRIEHVKTPSRKVYTAANSRVSQNRHNKLAPKNMSHINEPSKPSKGKVLEADISGVMFLEEEARAEIYAGETCDVGQFRIPLDPPQMSDSSFDDAFESLKQEYLSQLAEFHAGWTQKFLTLFKTKTDSKAIERAERTRRKSARLQQKQKFADSLPKDTPSRITKSALRQMNFLTSPLTDS